MALPHTAGLGENGALHEPEPESLAAHVASHLEGE